MGYLSPNVLMQMRGRQNRFDIGVAGEVLRKQPNRRAEGNKRASRRDVAAKLRPLPPLLRGVYARLDDGELAVRLNGKHKAVRGLRVASKLSGS